jgi:hypothetical protein
MKTKIGALLVVPWIFSALEVYAQQNTPVKEGTLQRPLKSFLIRPSTSQRLPESKPPKAKRGLACKSDFPTGTTTQGFKQEKLFANCGPLRRGIAAAEASATRTTPTTSPTESEIWGVLR